MIIEHELIEFDGRHFEIRRGDGDAEGAVIRLDGVSRKLAHRVREALDGAVAATLEASAHLKPGRAFAPHCDSTILHAPGRCEHCDKYPDWQAYRKTAHIAFSGEPDEKGIRRNELDYGPDSISPCPSTWFRAPEVRNRWPGNRPEGFEVLVVGDREPERPPTTGPHLVPAPTIRRSLLARILRRSR